MAGSFPDTTEPDGYEHYFVFGSGIKDDNLSNLLSNNISNSMIFGVNSNKSTVFLNGGSQRYVGIGTDNPLGALYVNTSDITGGAQNRGVIIGKSWVTDTIPSQTGSGVDLAIQGNVGIGSFSTTNKLSIVGANDDNQVLIWSSEQNIMDNEDIDLVVENKVIIGSTSTITSGNNYILQVNDDIYTTGVIQELSDIRYKENIKDFKDGLSLLKKINPVTYNFKDGLGLNSKRTNVGIIAQDLEKILPYAVSYDTLHTQIITEEAKIIKEVVNDSINRIAFDYDNIDSDGHYKYKDTIIYETREVEKFIPAEYSYEKESVLTYNKNALFYLMINSLKEVDYLRMQDSLNNLSINKQIIYKLDSLSVINKNLEEKILSLEQTIENLKRCCESHQIDLYEDVILEQNNPNPFDQTTSISYFIPDRLFPPFEIIITNIDGTIIYDRFVAENKIPRCLFY